MKNNWDQYLRYSRDERLCEIASKDNPVAMTNIPRSQREIYEQAIRDSGMNHLYISEGAVNGLGQVMPNYLRLMTTENKELAEFWNKVRELKPKTDSHG